MFALLLGAAIASQCPNGTCGTSSYSATQRYQTTITTYTFSPPPKLGVYQQTPLVVTPLKERGRIFKSKLKIKTK